MQAAAAAVAPAAAVALAAAVAAVAAVACVLRVHVVRAGIWILDLAEPPTWCAPDQGHGWSGPRQHGQLAVAAAVAEALPGSQQLAVAEAAVAAVAVAAGSVVAAAAAVAVTAAVAAVATTPSWMP